MDLDLDKLRELAELMDKYDLGEVCVEKDDDKVVLKKALPPPLPPCPPPFPPPGLMPPPVAAAPAAAPAPAEPAPAAPAAPAAEPEGVPVKAPLVGTFYRASSPEMEPFVKVGDSVTPATVVCIIEAMKVMNEVKAGVSGVVRRVLVENGAVVEFGQPLLLVSAE